MEELYCKLKQQYRSAADSIENGPVQQAAFVAKMAFVSFEEAELASRVRGIYRYGIGSFGLDMGGRSLRV